MLFSTLVFASLKDIPRLIKENDLVSLKKILEQEEKFKKDPHEYLMHLNIDVPEDLRDYEGVEREPFLTLCARQGSPDILKFLAHSNISISVLDVYERPFCRWASIENCLLTKIIQFKRDDLFEAAVNSLSFSDQYDYEKFIEEIKRSKFLTEGNHLEVLIQKFGLDLPVQLKSGQAPSLLEKLSEEGTFTPLRALCDEKHKNLKLEQKVEDMWEKLLGCYQMISNLNNKIEQLTQSGKE